MFYIEDIINTLFCGHILNTFIHPSNVFAENDYIDWLIETERYSHANVIKCKQADQNTVLTVLVIKIIWLCLIYGMIYSG